MTDASDLSLTNKKSAARAFDFIDRLSSIETVEELKNAFAIEAKSFGFNHFLFGQIPKKAEDLPKCILLNAWPDDWYQLYNDKGYALRDPAAQAVALNLLPYTWSDVQQKMSIPGTDKVVFDEARSWQMHDGFCIPVRSLDGLQAVVTLAGQIVDISESAKAALHLMAIYAYAKVIELSSSGAKHRPAQRLTRRERECTIWIAAGKSTWEIGLILGLSEQTVASYVKSAMHKLNVITRAQLVADALRLQEIAL